MKKREDLEGLMRSPVGLILTQVFLNSIFAPSAFQTEQNHEWVCEMLVDVRLQCWLIITIANKSDNAENLLLSWFCHFHTQHSDKELVLTETSQQCSC